MSEVIVSEENTEAVAYTDQILSSVGFKLEESDAQAPMVIETDNLNQSDKASYASRMMTGISYVLANMDEGTGRSVDKETLSSVTDSLNAIINKQVAEVFANPDFRKLESNWQGIYELAKNCDFVKTKLAVFDVSKDELAEDFEGNGIDVSGSDFFKNVYTSEYDQFGGEPYGSIVGIDYEFDRSIEDIEFLTVMGKISECAHAPFISAASPTLFDFKHYTDLNEVKDIDGLMAHPKYGRWNEFRKTRSAAYIGLTLPRYMVRAPYDPVSNPCRKGALSGFKEQVNETNPGDSCLWGNTAVMLSKNLSRSFQLTGWCQAICGPQSGGQVEGLPVYNYNPRDPNAYVLPVDFMIPDHKEYAFAKAGLISIVYEKGTSNAAFFSTQSLKLAEEFVDDADSENSQATTKLAYTFTTCRVAHYTKCMMRDSIGSEDDEEIIAEKLNTWILDYVNTKPNSGALSQIYYPFKAANIEVSKKSGMLGWYDCNITLLPHIKLEGMDVTMSIDTRLG